ncbi:MAG: DUF445 family protein [Verrucomicrobiota bacterium]|nr:DUF445 family protein [Verrucomicrobiota bacterium]
MLYLLPVIAALIGWVTNYLAVKMLFHPKLPIRLMGISIQGVFPKRQGQLAEKLGALVDQELFSVEEVSKKIKELSTSPRTMDQIGKRIERTIREKLVKSFPMLSMFLSDGMVTKVTETFKEELRDFMAQSADDLSTKLERELDVRKMVREKVEAFSTEKLEEILVSLMKKEFRFIELVGALLGFLIGCLQVGLTLAGQ